MQSDGNFTIMKRWLVGLSGMGVAVCSVILTKQGVGIAGDLAWMGTVVALALFCAELMFNSNFEDLNWTIIALGLGAYCYSIWTNVQGLYFYRGIEGNLWSHFDTTNFGGGLFMDIYPELAIAWAMKESKLGDLLGNIVKTAKNPDKLTQQGKPAQQQSQKPQGQYQQPRNLIPEYANREIVRNEQNSKPYMVPISNIRQEPKPQSNFPEKLKNQRRSGYPVSNEARLGSTYHPVSYQPDREPNDG